MIPATVTPVQPYRPRPAVTPLPAIQMEEDEREEALRLVADPYRNWSHNERELIARYAQWAHQRLNLITRISC